MKKDRQTSNPTKRSPKVTKTVDWTDTIFQWRQIPVSEAYIERLIPQLLREAEENERCYTLEQLLLKHKIPEKTFERWCDKFERLDETRDYIKMILCVRRENKALEKQLDTGTNNYVMPHYSKRWRDITEWRASLRQPKQQDAGNITIEMPCFHESKKEVEP